MIGGLGFFRNICDVDEGLENAGVRTEFYSGAQEKSPECSQVKRRPDGDKRTELINRKFNHLKSFYSYGIKS